MTTSSADPGRLDAYERASADMNEQLSLRLQALPTTYDSVVPRLQWGTFDASGTIGDLANFLRLNGVSDAWVATIAEAFRQADAATGTTALADTVPHDFLTRSEIPTGPREAITVDDPVMAGWPPTSGYADDPVCTATGHFVETELDLAMPWRAGPLRWTRTYSSRWREATAFGRGWWSWADVGVRAVEGGTVVVFPDGRRVHYGAGVTQVAGVPPARHPYGLRSRTPTTGPSVRSPGTRCSRHRVSPQPNERPM